MGWEQPAGWGGADREPHGGEVRLVVPPCLPQLRGRLQLCWPGLHGEGSPPPQVVGVHWVPVDGMSWNEDATGDAANTLALLLYALARWSHRKQD